MFDMRAIVEHRTEKMEKALSSLRENLDLLSKEFSYKATPKEGQEVYTFQHEPLGLAGERIDLLCNGKQTMHGTHVQYDSVRGYVVFDGAVEHFRTSHKLKETLEGIIEYLFFWMSTDAKLKSKSPEVEPG